MSTFFDEMFLGKEMDPSMEPPITGWLISWRIPPLFQETTKWPETTQNPNDLIGNVTHASKFGMMIHQILLAGKTTCK